MLAAAGEAPLTAYTKGDDNAIVLVQRQAPIEPHAMGLSETLNMVNHTGLPKWLSIDERRGMRLAIANALQNKTVTWTEPGENIYANATDVGRQATTKEQQ